VLPEGVVTVRKSGTHPVTSPRRRNRAALLAGVSMAALLMAIPHAIARPLSFYAATSATRIASDAAAQAAQQAATIAQQSRASLTRAIQAIQALKTVQSQAQAAARSAATGGVTDGLSAGGLIVDPRVSPGSAGNLWVNASQPSQTTSNGLTTVTITQTAPRAIMTWQQFNVGRNTILNFDQSGGNSADGNSWVALNRIDASGVPSQILGHINAQGTVLIINPNGIIFTGTSQINIHSLIASAMDFNSFSGTTNGAFKASGDAYVPITVDGLLLAPSDEANANAKFLGGGIFINGSFQTSINGNSITTGNSALFSAALVPGQSNAGVVIQPGASITASVSGTDNGGFVALLGPQVSNAGTIATSAGEIVLAAGSTVQIAEPQANSAQTTFAVMAGASITNTLLYTPPAVKGGALVLNDAGGSLISQRGNTTLNGDAIAQRGLIEATTSITRQGSIIIAANGTGSDSQAIFGPSSMTLILPEENGETIPSDPTSLANFTAPRIDVAGAHIDFQSGSWVFAPSATMTVNGPGQGPKPDGSAPDPVGRVLLETGSIIDLSGLVATRSVSDYLYTFKVTANDVADSPLAQSLIGKTVTIDLLQSGTRADGESWIGSPLFASSGAGYLANIAQGIDQLLTKGGSLTFGGGTSAANGQLSAGFTDVLQAAGALINVSGGLIQFTGAHISTTRLVGADGRLYDVSKADPFISYAGLAGQFTVSHRFSGLTETYVSGLLAGGYNKPGYVDGISAGSIAVMAQNPVLEGDIAGDIVIGANQRRLAQAGTGTNGAQATPDQLPKGAALTLSLVANAGDLSDSVVLAASAPDVLGPGFTIGSSLVLPAGSDGISVLTYSADKLTSFGLGSITISNADTLAVAEGASLSVLDGGSIKLASATTIDGTLAAHGGSITITGVPARPGATMLPDLVVGAHALIDVSGRWVNDGGFNAITGALYIDGGSVSLSAFNLSKDTGTKSTGTKIVTQDLSASIILQQGSVIDVSSGGYVGPNGKLAAGSDGLPKGKGGNLSLLTYAGTWFDNTIDPTVPRNPLPVYAPQAATNANVVMDGTIYAAGLSQGGTFTLQVPQVVIDGQASQVTSITSGAQAGTVVLPTSFFTNSGFGSFSLTSTYGSNTVTAGTTLTLKQQNYKLTASTGLPATGARLRDFANFGYLPDGLRHAVNLALSQNFFLYGVTGDQSATARLLIDQGASIVGDPLASISLNAGGPAVVLGSIRAPGGSISISEGGGVHFDAGNDGLPQYLLIGANAVLDVSGTYVPNPLVTGYSTGNVLPGGSISVSGAGVVIALAGSIFDIAGASGTVEVPVGAGLIGPHFATLPIWSNGGSLTLSTTGAADANSYHSLYFAGSIEAAGGAPEAAGGTLKVSLASGGIIVSQSGDVASWFGAAMPTTRTQLHNLVPTTSGVYLITADTIDSANSGLDTVSFNGALYFSGNVDLNVAGSILISSNSGAVATLLPQGVINTAFSVTACTPTASCIPTIGHTNVTLEAGYISVSGNSSSTFSNVLPTLADGTLTLMGRQGIDIVGIPVVKNAGTVNLVSDGDVRLIGTDNTSLANGATSDGYGGLPWVGGFLVADNLNITAREIYPATGTAYLLMSLGLAPAGASGTHDTITFASSGAAPVTPLSAGGAIVVDAKSIVQGGALFAPLGTIQLGFGSGQSLPGVFTVFGSGNDPYDPVEIGSGGAFGLFGPNITTVATGSVTLQPGSLTSVSAGGLMIPYGTTVDGTNWAFNSKLLSGPPAKLIVLGGASVQTQAGAMIDGSGGGEIYATEFVPGTGGSRNVLTTTTQTVYALVPGYSSSLAPSDPTFTTKVAAGLTVTIPGGNGVPGGTYTLLPAEYATLPGAYRVVVVSTNANPAGKTTTTMDGSVYMTGVLGNAINGSRSSQTALLQIQPNSVWTRYTEIDIAKGASYFTALAANNGTAAPRLAQDAARMVVAATNSLVLNAVNLFAPADGGLGGQLDITGTNLLVVASDLRNNFNTTTTGPYNGYLLLDADVLSRIGIESILIGGFRSNTTEGTRITATASNLEVATDTAHALSGPELLFTSLAPTAASASIRGVVVDSGSVITAKGAVAGNSTAALVFGADPVAKFDTNGNLTGYTAGVSGDGSLLRVSNGGLVNVVRHFVPGVYQIPSTTPAPTGPVSKVALGSLTIGAGVTLSGNTLTLDSSGTTTVPDSATLTAKNYDLSGSIINLGGGTGGLVVSAVLIGNFAGADIVRLRSASVFNIYGSNTFGSADNPIGTLILDGAGLYSDGGATTIAARNVELTSSQATANLKGANTGGSGGSLTLAAGETLTFGAGTKTLVGFAAVTGNAGTKVLFTGGGSLDAGGASVSLAAPLFLVAGATSQSLTTTGALSLSQSGTAPDLDPTIIGGILALTGGSIDVNGTLAAFGGSLTLEATTGDLTLSDNALLTAAGTRITIGDLIQDSPAGNIRLFADVGNVRLGTDTTVDVSGAGSGYAGTLSIFAGATATLSGTLKGAARYDDLGGEFALIANQLATGLPLNAGFTRSFEVSLGQGDITIGAGQTLKSEKVLLVANTGSVIVDGSPAKGVAGGIIDASAPDGGTIALYGAAGVTVGGAHYDANNNVDGAGAHLTARYQAPDVNSPGYANGESTLVRRGGTITLGTTGKPDRDANNVIKINDTYGYQNVSGSGAITVASGAVFDVSGGAGGANIDNTGGSVVIRAPILTNNTINVSFNGTVVTNAKADGSASGDPLVVNAFAVWSTTDSYTDINKHFDGIIDPAGFFDATGTQIITATSGLYPTSTADAPAPGTYLPHVNFYQTTLRNFVESGLDTNAIAASLAGARLQVGGGAATVMPPSAQHVRPEIDLVNPSTDINGGNITVASNWNFGAGSVDNNGNVTLVFRTTNGSEPGTLTLRAVNNIRINASVSDGFWGNLSEPTQVTTTEQLPPTADSFYQLELLSLSKNPYGSFDSNGNLIITLADGSSDTYFNLLAPYFGSSLLGPTTLQSPNEFQNPTGDPNVASLIDQYSQYYQKYTELFDVWAKETNWNQTFSINSSSVGSYLPPAAPAAGTIYYNLSGAQPGTGTDYVSRYENYFIQTVVNINQGAYDGTNFSSVVQSDLCTSCVVYAAPFAPAPQLDAALQAGYKQSTPVTVTVTKTVNVDLSPVQNAIANNPATYNGFAIYNSTSSANLMTAAMSGKGSFSYDFVGGAQFNADGTSAVNPDAVVQLSSLSSSLTGDVSIDGHTSYVNSLRSNQFSQFTVVVPTMVRTGTGSITMVAAGDFATLDSVAPGTIYTAGHVADNAQDFAAPTLPVLPAGTLSNGLITTPVWATGGGNIIVSAGRDIIGIETPVDAGNQFSNNGSSAGVSTGEFWSAWYYVNGQGTGSATAPFDPSAGGVQQSSWINYGTFFQGFGALGGGNITLQAGRNVKDVSASLPETIQYSGGQSAAGPAATAHYYGGGDLLVEADGDVLSGVYYVGRGTGTIRAGGSVVSDATLYQSYLNYPNVTTNNGQTKFSVPLLLATQDGYIGVQAAGSIDLGGIFQPTQIPADLTRNFLPNSFRQSDAARTLPSAIGASFDSYGPSSGVTLLSRSGSIKIDSLRQSDGTGFGSTDTLFTHGGFGFAYDGTGSPHDVIASSLSATALTGDIDLVAYVKTDGAPMALYASPNSTLSLIAGGSVNGYFGLGYIPVKLTVSGSSDTPVLIYAGEDIGYGSFHLSSPVRMWAGRDIVDFTFIGQNNADDDITSIYAGRDILAKIMPDFRSQTQTTTFMLYGPGDFVVEAGRNLGPFSSYGSTGGGGIFAIGDGSNSGSTSTVISSLPHQAANITLRYGVAKGIDYAAAISKYGDPATAVASGLDFVSAIVPQIEQLVDQLIVERAKAAGIANPSAAVSLTLAEAAEVFTALSSVAINDKLTALAAKAGFAGLAFNLTPAQFVSLLQQQDALKLEIDRGFLAVLKQVGLDYKDPSSPNFGKYARAYEAIATMFPASLGYTDNSGGGTGVVPPLKHTGDLRMAHALVETQTGGDISILGPGGNAFVGSNSADNISPSGQGILTLEGGSVRTYTDGSALIYQSRVFTEQGGNVEMFSANGDLNAGKGKKSSAAYPPLRLICDSDGYCRVNPAGLVTGAGIGALLSIPGQDPSKSNAILTAPHGIIDAGAAGIRVAGDAFFNALKILNSFNIQVSGKALGLPTVQGPPVGALTTASNVAGSAVRTEAPIANNNANQPSVIIVEVLGYGGESGNEDNPPARQDERRDRKPDQQSYDRSGMFRVLGNGEFTNEQMKDLTDEERSRLIRAVQNQQ
jgi:filamentous hemagglutinin family protein